MTEEPTNIFRGVNDQSSNDDKAVILMTKPTTKEIFITGKKGRGFQTVKVAQNLFKVLPLRATDVPTDLLWPQAGLSQKRDLMFGDM